jgi:lipopolysaccharide export system ATP-binding protein
MSTLAATRIAKHYQGRQVVKDVSLKIETGEVVGLLGPNGAGKTTCFYIIVGLIMSDHGQILLDNQDLTYAPMHVRARAGIGYLPQEPSIFRKLTTEENILAVLQLRKISKERQHQHLEELLNNLHITHIRHTMGLSLSGGERRRVEIARALAMEPKFILLDEPFSGIDPISILDIKRMITQLSELGIGVLITDHNVRETLTICQRAYIVSSGEVICFGSPQDVLVDEKVRKVYLGHEFDL